MSTDRNQQRNETAEFLFASLQQHSVDSVARLEAIAKRLKIENPNLAERVDWIMGQVIARAQQMPMALTALYLTNTQELPEVIEGEVVEVKVIDTQSADK